MRKNDILTQFGVRLRFARKNSRYTQVEVANYLNLNDRNVSRYENGESFPSVESLVRLCKMLNVSSDYLIGISDTFRPPEDTNRDYIFITNAEGVRCMYNIPDGSRDRLYTMLKTVFPEIIEDNYIERKV